MIKNLQIKRSAFDENSKNIIRKGFKEHTDEMVGEEVMQSFSGTEYELYGFYDEKTKKIYFQKFALFLSNCTG